MHPSPRLILSPAQGAFRTRLTEDLATLAPGWHPLEGDAKDSALTPVWATSFFTLQSGSPGPHPEEYLNLGKRALPIFYLSILFT